MYILQYDYVALLLNMINLGMFLFLKNLRDPKSGVLFFMLINSLLATVLDILSSLVIGHPEQYSRWYCLLVTNLYYLLNNNKVYMYIIYVCMLAGMEKVFKRWQKHLILLPYLFTTVMILLNPFTRYVFHIDSDLVYRRGMGLNILYVIAFVYLVLWSTTVFRYIKTMERAIYRALVTFVIIYLLGTFIQTLYPKYLLQSFCTAMSELLIIMVLQNRKEVIDGTTQLYNQKAFYHRIKGVFVNDIPTYVTLIVLEDTKRINYTLGYSYLQKTLREVARFMKAELKLGEKFYIRNGCFALLCTSHSDKQCSKMKAKLTERLNHNWYINDLNIKLTARISQFMIPEQMESYSDVYEYVDNLFTATSEGRKDKQPNIKEINFSTYTRERKVKKAIALAMKNKTFEVYYQPIYSVKDQGFVSAEALVRLQDPELGFIPPDEFIPLTERDGSITIIGMQIFEMVCSFLRHSELDKYGIQYIEVNLSVVQCMQKNIEEQLSAILDKYQIKPQQICLEITETVAVKTPEVVRKLFHAMDKQGMTFAMDDYGSGYSNVNYILELPFHFVKLDKSIVWDYFKDDAGKISLESSIAMMKSLNIELIAEGVETMEQGDTLTKLGVNYLQGYYFSRPIPSDEFLDFIVEKNRI